MRHLDLWMKKYAERSSEIHDELEQYGHWTTGFRKSLKGVDLIREIPENPGQFKSCYVDGGEGLYELLGLGVYFIRASSLVDLGEGYSFLRDLDLNLIEYSDFTKQQVELKREVMELDLAIKSLDKGCDMIVLDGSLYVKSSMDLYDFPESNLFIEKLRTLYENATENEASIVGVSEDSKSRILTNLLGLELGMSMPSSLTDSTLLRIVGGNSVYCTKILYPKTKTHLNPKIKETFPTIYLQSTPLANPLRIDFFNGEKNIEKITAKIQDLSRSSRSFGYPLPLYLAHMDSQLKQNQVEWTARQIIKQAFKSNQELCDALLRDTRRNKRPK